MFIISRLDSTVATEWAQNDLLKLLDAMKVALPQKDLTKYKTSESHLDWQKVAFNSYTAEMCKQKWQEVSKEVRHIFKRTHAEGRALSVLRQHEKGFHFVFRVHRFVNSGR